MTAAEPSLPSPALETGMSPKSVQTEQHCARVDWERLRKIRRVDAGKEFA